MRTDPGTYRLTFLLPPAIGLLVQPGRHQPCLHGCVLSVARTGVVAIEAASRERLFDQTARFLKLNGKERPAYTVAAIVCSPDGGRDTWHITVGADVAFAPSALPPEIPQLERAG